MGHYNLLVAVLFTVAVACFVLQNNVSVVPYKPSERSPPPPDAAPTRGDDELLFESAGPAPPDKAYSPVKLGGAPRTGVEKPVILVWQAPYCPKEALQRGDGYCVPEKYTMPCSEEVRRRCTVTTDRRKIREADAVVVPLAAKFVMGKEFEKVKGDAVVVSWGAEAPTSNLGVPYGDDTVYNWTMSYRRDADVAFPYLWDIYFRIATEARFENLRNKTMFEPDGLSTKHPEAVAIVGNCMESRKAALDVLSTQYPTHLRGKCWDGSWVHTHEELHLYRSSLFHISFENTYCADYVTEKYWRALTWGAVPVVNGPPEAYRGSAAINANDFNSSTELADYLRKVASTPSLLEKHLSYRRHAPSLLHTSRADGIGWCRLCEKLTESQPRQHYPSLGSWLSQNGTACPAEKGTSWRPQWAESF